MNNIVLGVPLPLPKPNGKALAHHACDVGAECPGEQALGELKLEQGARVNFDEQIAINVDRLGDVTTGLELQLKGLTVVTSNLEHTATALGDRLTAVERAIAPLKNVKYWIALVIGAAEIARESGLAGVVKTIVKALVSN